MISIKYSLAGCAVAAMLGAAAATGLAHAQPMGGPPGGPSGGPSGASGQSSQMRQLHDSLHLNPHQEQAWQAYQAGIQPTPDQQQRMRAMSQMPMSGMTTPQRLDMINEGLTMQMEAFHRRADATRAFYATLNPAQQHSFDQITAPPSRGGQGQR